MTLFEYVTVAVSLVLSLAVVRLLDGLRFAASRERGYPIHLLWVLTKLIASLEGLVAKAYPT